MKRISNLYEKICSVENLKLADQKARKGKLNTYGVKVHDRNREKNIIKLHESLVNGTFRTSEYDIFMIYEPKEREIYRLPYYPDRIVHHAIMNIQEPIWVSVFTQDTYSCIKDRGIHKCAFDIKTVLRTDKAGSTYCLKMDIKKFYPSIDHEVMKAIIRRKIKDKQLLVLIDEIIDSADGLPIGNYLSQYLANLYLTYFDHWIKEDLRVKHYFRYADDMVILSSSKNELHALRQKIEEYLNRELKLELKNNWRVFPASTGIDFVGYVFYPTHTVLRKSIKKNLCRKISRLNKVEDISEEGYKRAVASWWGWCKYCNSINLINKLNKKSKYEIIF